MLPPPRTIRSGFLQHFRVIHALMLRDIKTRMGASYFGFALGMLLPLGHILVLLTIYIVLGRHAPIGTDVTIYISTALVPFITWSYTHQKVMHSFNQNRALTAFPIVKFTDIIIARALVELLNVTVIAVVVAATLTAIEKDLLINNAPGVLYALLLAYAFGVSTGFVFGILTLLAPAIMVVGFLFIPLTWVSSGVFFIPDGVPLHIRQITSAFPMSHVVDFARTAYYGGYISDYANLNYVHIMILANITIALAANYFLRAALTTK